jgi:hypothetical protein
MAVLDSNELHAWIRVNQDAKGLKELSDLCQKRIDLLRTPKGGGEPKKAFQNMTDHLSGGDLAPPMTGPGVHMGANATTSEQAGINDAIVQKQVEDDRRPDENLVRTVTVDGGDQKPEEGAKKEEPKRASRARGKQRAK